jgi:hypothetical protein
MSFQNVAWLWMDCMVLYPRTQNCGFIWLHVGSCEWSKETLSSMGVGGGVLDQQSNYQLPNDNFLVSILLSSPLTQGRRAHIVCAVLAYEVYKKQQLSGAFCRLTSCYLCPSIHCHVMCNSH